MKTIKFLQRRILQGILRSAVFVSEYGRTLNAVKTTAVMVAVCFLLTSVCGQGLAAIAEESHANKQFNQIFSDFVLPYSYGKITSSNFAGSESVVINIQDLHSHPEVQKNISNIIDAFDKKFGIAKVYLEGAYGELDTSWLTAIKDKETAVKVLDSMLNSGRLTGAEYYSAISGRTDIIRGLENKEEYLENLQRFGKILEDQNRINIILAGIKEDLNRLKKTYYNRQQKKLDELSRQYLNGEIEARKYFALLYKHTDKLGIDVSKYENTDAYKTLLALEKGLDYKRISLELNALVLKLKETLPFSAYKMILDSTNNFADADKLYIYLIRLAKEYDLNLDINFSNLNKFFAYIELSQKINPLELIKEEQRLVDEINERFSVNESERDIVFLAGFNKYLADFLSSKITSDDYRYYEENKDEFERLWIKYIDNKKLDLLGDYRKFSETFYAVNIDRNKYFFDNIDGLVPSANADVYAEGSAGAAKIINDLENKKAKTVYVIITGGFHTQGVSDYLKEHGISTIAITPNVSDGVQLAEEKYYQIAKEQSKILFQALAVLNTTQAPDTQKLELAVQSIADAFDRNWNDVERVLRDMLKGDAYEGMSASMNKEGKNIVFTFEKAGKRKVTVTYDTENRQASALQSAEPLEMSVGSRGPIKKASAAAFAAAGLTFFASLFFAVPVLPFVAVITMLASGSYFAFSEYEIKNLEQISASALAESDISDNEVTVRVLEKLKDALAHGLYMEFLKKVIKPADGTVSRKEIDRLESLMAAASEIADLEKEIKSLTAKRTAVQKNASRKNARKEKQRKNAISGINKTIVAKQDEVRAKIAAINEKYGTGLKDYNELQDAIAATLSSAVENSGSAVAMQFEADGFIHLNYRLLAGLFLDNKTGGIKNEKFLEVVVRHELRHAKTAAKAEKGNRFAKFIHSNKNLEEVFVSLGDFPDFIASFIAPLRNWFASLRSSASGFLSQRLQIFAPQTLSPEIIEAFRDYMVSLYGESARNSAQTNIQILAAKYIAAFKDVHLGTGGGKTNAGRLALAQILADTGGDISFTGGLYMTKDSQIVGDMAGFDSFINSPGINSILAESGVVSAGQSVKFGYILTNEKGEKVFYVVENGKGVERTVNAAGKKYTFADLQNECAVVGGVMSDFSHLYQQGRFSKDKRAFFGLNDEGHESLSDKANSPNSIAGSAEVENAREMQEALGEIFSLALDIRKANEEAGSDDGEYREYTVKQRRVMLSDRFGYEFGDYKPKMAAIQEKYPFLNEKDILHYIESSLSTMYSNEFGNDYRVENGKIVLLSAGVPQYGQTRKDWGHFLLEKWAEQQGHADFKGEYTLETKTLSQQTNAVFIHRIFGGKYAAYSGSLMDISKKVKRLYARKVKYISSTEVSRQIDKENQWAETEDEKFRIIARRIADALKDGHSSVPVRVESPGQALKIQNLLEKEYGISREDVFIFATEGTMPEEKIRERAAKGYADPRQKRVWESGNIADIWNYDRDGLIDVLKSHLQMPARVALVTSAAATGVDLRTNLKNGVDVFKSFDTVTGSYITQQQYRGRVGRGGDKAEYARVYSLESLEAFRNIDTASSELIDKIIESVRKGDIKKADRLYKKLQDMIYDEEIAQSERVKRQGDMLDRAALEFEALKDAYTKTDENGEITGWHRLVFGKKDLNYEEIGKAGYPHITGKEELERRGKWLAEQFRKQALRNIENAYSDFLRAVEISGSRSASTVGDTFEGFLQQIAETDPESENIDRFDSALSDFFNSVQRKTMLSTLINVPADAEKGIGNYKITSAVFGRLEGDIYNPFPELLKNIVGKPIGAVLKIFDAYAPVIVRSVAAVLASSVLLASQLSALGINIAAVSSFFASMPLLGSFVSVISALAAPQLILIAAAGFLITLLLKNLFIDRIAKYDQESGRKTAVAEFKADPTVKNFSKAAFAVFNKVLTAVASTSVYGAVGILFIGFFVPSVLPLAVIFAAIGVLSGALAALININKLAIMSKAVPDKSSSVSANIITGIGIGAVLFGVALGLIPVLPALIFAGLLSAIQYAGKTDYLNFKKSAATVAAGLAVVAIPGILFALGIVSATVAIPAAVIGVMGLMLVMAVSGAFIRAKNNKYIDEPVEELKRHGKISKAKESGLRIAFTWMLKNMSVLLKPSIVKISALGIVLSAVTAALAVSPFFWFGTLLLVPVIAYKPFDVFSDKARQNRRSAIIGEKIWNNIEENAKKEKGAKGAQFEIQKKKDRKAGMIKTDGRFYGLNRSLRRMVSSRTFKVASQAAVAASAAVVVMGATANVAYAQEGDTAAVEETSQDTEAPDSSAVETASDEQINAMDGESPVTESPASETIPEQEQSETAVMESEETPAQQTPSPETEMPASEAPATEQTTDETPGAADAPAADEETPVQTPEPASPQQTQETPVQPSEETPPLQQPETPAEQTQQPEVSGEQTQENQTVQNIIDKYNLSASGTTITIPSDSAITEEEKAVLTQAGYSFEQQKAPEVQQPAAQQTEEDARLDQLREDLKTELEKLGIDAGGVNLDGIIFPDGADNSHLSAAELAASYDNYLKEQSEDARLDQLREDLKTELEKLGIDAGGVNLDYIIFPAGADNSHLSAAELAASYDNYLKKQSEDAHIDQLREDLKTELEKLGINTGGLNLDYIIFPAGADNSHLSAAELAASYDNYLKKQSEDARLDQLREDLKTELEKLGIDAGGVNLDYIIFPAGADNSHLSAAELAAEYKFRQDVKAELEKLGINTNGLNLDGLIYPDGQRTNLSAEQVALNYKKYLSGQTSAAEEDSQSSYSGSDAAQSYNQNTYGTPVRAGDAAQNDPNLWDLTRKLQAAGYNFDGPLIDENAPLDDNNQYPLYYTVEKYGLGIRVYPYNKWGSYVFDIDDLNYTFDSYKALIDDGYQVIYHSDSFSVTDKNGLTIDIYLFDSAGNRTFDISKVNNIFKSYNELVGAFGKENVAPKVDSDGNFYFEITYADGKIHKEYIFDEDGKYAFDIDSVKIIVEALRKGKDGAYIPVNGDSLLDSAIAAKNDAVAALAEQAQSDQTGTAEDTRPWYRKFFDWLLGKVGIITASAEEAKKKEIAAAEAANNEAAVMAVLKSVEKSEDITDDEGNITGREAVTVTGVRKIVEEDGTVKFVYVYQKEYFSNKNGTMESVGTEHFVEYDGTVYRVWFNDETRNMLDEAKSGYGAFASSMLYINEDTNGEGVYFASAFSIEELENDPNFITRWDGSTLETLYRNNDGTEIHLQQIYGDYYSKRNKEINEMLSSLESGEVSSIDVSRTRVFLGNTFEYVTATGTETFDMSNKADREKASELLQDANIIFDETTGKYFDNNSVSVSEDGRRVVVTDTEDGSGYVFDGQNTGQKDDEGAAVYRTGQVLSYYRSIDYDDLSSEDNLGRTNKGNLDTLFELVQKESGFSFPYKPEDLHWTRTETYDANGNVLYTTWQAYSEASGREPVVEIDKDGFVDFSGSYDGIDIGLRYDTHSVADGQKPLNLVVPAAGVGTLVINYYDGSVFVEDRAGEGYLRSKYHITVQDATNIITNKGGTFPDTGGDWRATMDSYMSDWKRISQSDDINSMIGNVNALGNGDIFEVTRREDYSYEDTLIDGDAAPEVQGFYSGSALAFYGIPSGTITYRVDGNGNPIGEAISESVFKGIDWNEERIYSNEKIHLNGKSDSGIESEFREIDKQSDFNGNVLQQFDIEEGKYVSGIIVPEYNRHGIGVKSYTVVFDNGKCYVVSSSEFNSRVSANAIVYDDNVNTIMFAHERTQVEDVNPLAVNAETLNRGVTGISSLNIFNIQSDLIDSDGNLIDNSRSNKIYTEKSYLFNNAEGRNVITLSNLLLGSDGEIVKPTSSNASELERTFGTPAIISYGRYSGYSEDSATASVIDEQRQMMLGHPSTVVSYAYAGTLDFEAYGAQDSDGNLVEDPKEAFVGSNFITRMNNLRVVTLDDGTNALVYTSYANPDFKSDNFWSGVALRLNIDGYSIGNEQKDAVAKYYSQMDGLNVVCFKSDGTKYFEVYDYALGDSPLGTFSDQSYEVNILNRRGVARYGFLINGEDTGFSSDNDKGWWYSFIGNVQDIESEISDLERAERKTLAELASDYDTQERIPYNDKLKITKIFAYVDTSAKNGFAVNNVYYEPSHFNTGVAPIYLKYTYRYGKTGVLESKDQTALKQDWQDEIRTIKISISRFFKKLPMPVRIALVMIPVVGAAWLAFRIIDAVHTKNKKIKQIRKQKATAGKGGAIARQISARTAAAARANIEQGIIASQTEANGFNLQRFKRALESSAVIKQNHAVFFKQWAEDNNKNTDINRATEGDLNQYVEYFLKRSLIKSYESWLRDIKYPGQSEKIAEAEDDSTEAKRAAAQKLREEYRQYVRERQSLEGSVDTESIFDEYKWWLKNVMGQENTDDLRFTNEDLLLFYYIYIACDSMRQETAGFKCFLFYKAKEMIDKGEADKAAYFINIETSRFMQFVDKGVTIEQQVQQMEYVLDQITEQYKDKKGLFNRIAYAIKTRRLKRGIEYYKANKKTIDEQEKAYKKFVPNTFATAKSPQFFKYTELMDKYFKKYGFRALFGVKGGFGARVSTRPDENFSYYDIDAIFRNPSYVSNYSSYVDKSAEYTRDNDAKKDKTSFNFVPQTLPFRTYIPYANQLQNIVNARKVIALWLGNLAVTGGIVAFFMQILAFSATALAAVSTAGIVIAVVAAVTAAVYFALSGIEKYLQQYMNPVNAYFGKTVMVSQDRGLSGKRDDIKKAKISMVKRYLPLLTLKTAWESLLLYFTLTPIFKAGFLTFITNVTIGKAGLSSLIAGSVFGISTQIFIPILLGAVLVVKFYPKIKTKFTQKFTDLETGKSDDKKITVWSVMSSVALFISPSVLIALLPLIPFAPGVFYVVFMIMPILAFTFLDFYGFNDLFKAVNIRLQKIKLGAFVGKSWADFRNYVYDKKGTSHADSLVKGDFFNEWVSVFLPENIERKLTPQEKQIAFAMYFNKVVEDYYRLGKISKEEYKKYRFEISEYKQGNNLNRVITKYPDLSKQPSTFGAKELFFRLHKETRERAIEGYRQPNLRDISLNPVVPANDEAVTYLLSDGELNKEGADGHTLLTHIINVYSGEWKNMLTRLQPVNESDNEISISDAKTIRKAGGKVYAVDFRGRKKELSEDDLEVIERMNDMLDKDNFVKKGQALTRADGSNLPECWVNEEITRWVDPKLQPLSPLHIGLANLRDTLDFLAEIEFADERKGMSEEDWQKAMHQKVDDLNCYEAIVGYQQFGKIYNDGKGANDARVIGLFRNLKEFNFFTTPVLHGRTFKYADYKHLKDLQKKGLVSSSDIALITEIEKTPIGKQWKKGTETQDEVKLVSFRRLKAVEADYEKYKELKEKETKGILTTAEEFLLKQLELEVNKEKAKYERWKNEDREQFLVKEYETDGEAAVFKHNGGNLKVVIFDDGDVSSVNYRQYKELVTKRKRGNISEAENILLESIERAIEAESLKYEVFGTALAEYDEASAEKDKDFVILKNSSILSDLEIDNITDYINLTEKDSQSLTEEEKDLLNRIKEAIEEEKRKYEEHRTKLAGYDKAETDDDKIKVIFGDSFIATAFDDGKVYSTPFTGMGGGGIFAQGKVDHHTYLESYINKRFILQLDMNQGLYGQSALTFFTALQPLLQDDEVYNVSLQEHIPTERLTRVGAKGSLAEAGFNASHEDMNDMWQLHMYGHPNLLRSSFLKSKTGQSKSVVSEDMAGGKFAKAKGGKTVTIHGTSVEKTREAGVSFHTGMVNKFAMGSGEFAQSPMEYEYQKAQEKAFGPIGSIFSFSMDFFEGPGFYFKERLVVPVVRLFLFGILFMGISPFASLPIAFVLAVFGVILSQNAGLPGLVTKMMGYEEGWNYSKFGNNVVLNRVWNYFGSWFLWAKGLFGNFKFFVTQIMTHWDGRIKGTKGRAAYVNTGRGPGIYKQEIIPGGKDNTPVLSALFDSHFVPSASTIFIVVAAFIYKFTPATQAFSFLYILIPFAYILGQTQMLAGYNVMIDGPRLAFKNLLGEWKKLPQAIKYEVTSKPKDEWKKRPIPDRIHYTIVSSVVLLTLTAADIIDTFVYGMFKFGPQHIVEYFKQKNWLFFAISLAEAAVLVFAVPFIFSFLPYLALISPIVVKAGVIIVSALSVIVSLPENLKKQDKGISDDLKKAVEAYNVNKNKRNAAKVEKALAKIDINIEILSEETINSAIEEIIGLTREYYGLSEEEAKQQINLIKAYAHRKKHGGQSNVAEYMSADNLDAGKQKNNHPELIMEMAEIDDEYGTEKYIGDITVVFSLMMAGIGSSLDRVSFLKAWAVLKDKVEKANAIKDENEKQKALDDLSEAVKTLEFLKWDSEYQGEEPQQKTKAVDIGLRVKVGDKYMVKSVAQILLDGLIERQADGFKGLSLNLLTNEDSLVDINEALDTQLQDKDGNELGVTYRDILIGDGSNIAAVLGESAKDGIDIQKMHPAVRYDSEKKILGFYPKTKYPLGHARHLVVQGPQLMEDTGVKSGFNVITNSDNYLAAKTSAKLFGYMKEKKAAVGILVTKKGTSEGNKKGGIPMVFKTAVNGVETVVFKIVEIAQVKGKTDKDGKSLEDTFQEAQEAFFNTNIIVINKDEFRRKVNAAGEKLKDPQIRAKIKRMYGLTGDEQIDELWDTKFAQADLIENDKGEYVQLEGAVASGMMELSNLVYAITGEHLIVYFQLDDSEAGEMFGPIKNKANFEETLERAVVEQGSAAAERPVEAARSSEDVKKESTQTRDYAKQKAAGAGKSAVTEEKRAKDRDKTASETKSVSISGESERNAIEALLAKHHFALTPRTRALSLEEIKEIAKAFERIGVDTESFDGTIPARIVLRINEDGPSNPGGWLDRSAHILEAAELEITVDNLIKPPYASAAIKKALNAVRSIKEISRMVQGWIEANIVPERRGKSIDANMMIYSTNGRLDAGTVSEVEKSLGAGLAAVAMERVNARHNVNSDRVKIKPNTVVMVEHGGRTYKVKVEHYMTFASGIPVIQTVVLNNWELNKAVPASQRARIYDEVYNRSVKHFAVDVNDNKKQMQHDLGVSGVGMIVYMNDGFVSGDIKVNGAVVKASAGTGVFELPEEERKLYCAEENGIAGHMKTLFGKIAAKKDFGKAEQKPGYGYGLALNTDRSRVFGSAYTAMQFMNAEKGKNVETVRASNAKIGEVLAALSGESSSAKKSDIEKIKNLLDSDNDIAKIVDLPKLSGLITSSGELSAEGVTLIRRAFENGFTGVHTDASGISDTAVLSRALGEINSIARKNRVDFSNYVSFESLDSDAAVVDAAAIRELADKHKFTPVIKIGEKGERISPEKVQKALGNLENAAVEIEGISTGDELTKVQGRIVLAWLHTSAGVAKDKSRAGSAKKKLGSAYKSALSSDYLSNMNAAAIKELVKFMAQEAFADAGKREKQFEDLLEALKKAGIEENSALYNYILDMKNEASVENYESARGYLRGAVEKYLETLYMESLGAAGKLYRKKISISDRNALRGLLLHLAVNGEVLGSSSDIQNMLDGQRELLKSETGTLAQLRADSNEVINSILEDPLKTYGSDDKENIAKAKKAFAVLTDMAASGFAFEKAVESAKQGTIVSAGVIRSMLAAA